MISREKTGILPSYMDKSIHTRSCMNMTNLKTLEMNCMKMKPSGKKKRANKENFFANRNSEVSVKW